MCRRPVTAFSEAQWQLVQVPFQARCLSILPLSGFCSQPRALGHHAAVPCPTAHAPSAHCRIHLARLPCLCKQPRSLHHCAAVQFLTALPQHLAQCTSEPLHCWLQLLWGLHGCAHASAAGPLSLMLSPADLRAGGGSCCMGNLDAHSNPCDGSASTEHTHAKKPPTVPPARHSPSQITQGASCCAQPPAGHHLCTLLPAGPFAPLCTPRSSRRQPLVALTQAFQAIVPC